MKETYSYICPECENRMKQVDKDQHEKEDYMAFKCERCNDCIVINKSNTETIVKRYEIKAGDTVLHKPTKEEWCVIGVNQKKNKICVAGYPPTIAYLSDCEYVETSKEGITQEELDYRKKEFGCDWD